MKKILVIDDERTFKFKATYARNLKEAFDQVLTFPAPVWDEIWLDHDLGNGEEVYKLTSEVEKLSFEFRAPFIWVGTFVIHSSNPVGRERMKASLIKYFPVRMVRAEDYM